MSSNDYYWQSRALKIVLWLVEKVWVAPDLLKTIFVTFSQVQSNGLVFTGDIEMAELREGQEFNVTAMLKTRAGNPASYDEESVQWESSDPSIASVTADENNPLKAKVKGLNGTDNAAVVISFRADGDPDSNETREIVATLDVVVTQGEARVVELSNDTAVDSPDAPPAGGGEGDGGGDTGGDTSGDTGGDTGDDGSV